MKSRERRISADVGALAKDMVEIRRDLHAHPEMAFREERTAAIVAKHLRSLGVETKTGVAKTGVVGLIRGNGKKTVALRADMDALPITEIEKKKYGSVKAGVMHACGHDGHVAILMTVASVLSRRRKTLPGNVKLLFQPAEESPGGAEPMIRAGVLKNPEVDAIFGLHMWNDFPVGRLGIRPGPLLAAADKFEIVIRAKGGHGAAPHQTPDPIVAAAHAIQGLQSLSSRRVDPLKPIVCSVGRIRGGDAFNVIPPEVEFAGTIRTFDPKLREKLPGMVRDIVGSSVKAFGADFDMKYTMYYPATINDKAMTAIVHEAAAGVVGEGSIDTDVQTLGGEDMSYFLNEVPGCFYFLGSRNEKRGLCAPHHNNRFDFDEEALPLGVETLVRSVETWFGKQAGTVDESSKGGTPAPEHAERIARRTCGRAGASYAGRMTAAPLRQVVRACADRPFRSSVGASSQSACPSPRRSPVSRRTRRASSDHASAASSRAARTPGS